MVEHCEECEDFEKEVDYLLDTKEKLRSRLGEMSTRVAELLAQRDAAYKTDSKRPPMSRARFRQEAVLRVIATGLVHGDTHHACELANDLTAAVFDGSEE